MGERVKGRATKRDWIKMNPILVFEEMVRGVSSFFSFDLGCGCGVNVLQTCNWHICAILLTNIFSDGLAMNYWLS